MPTQVSGKRYAQAIFELAKEQDQLDQWAGDLQLVFQALQDEEFNAFLKHAEVPAADKVTAIGTVLSSVHPLVQNLVHILVSGGLVDLLPQLHEAYESLLDEYRDRQRVEVTSAIPLEDRELERITTFLSGLIQKEVVATTVVDESILGGVVIRMGDRLLDGSARSRLEGLRNRLHAGVRLS
ncbi:MAG: hypothetical protein BZY88_04410 [SAR202 cluster bacterium Io17-Chloro-G9]|nr:MAG: hypothetical protein BZY88_04410 [SAR202 cluster bacterium Io17-Chloro-G9]